MIYFVFGGSASGKSEYAENLAVSCAAEAGKKPASGGHRALELSDGPAETAAGCREKSGGLLYAATMRNDSPEAAARIRKHQEQRREKGFRLYEAQSLSALREIHRAHTVLFDCLSGFAANVMFSGENLRKIGESEKMTAENRDAFFENMRISLREEIGEELRNLSEKCENLVVVSDAVFSDGTVFSPETEAYIRLMGDLWRMTARHADSVTEVVFGLPVKVK